MIVVFEVVPQQHFTETLMCGTITPVPDGCTARPGLMEGSVEALVASLSSGVPCHGIIIDVTVVQAWRSINCRYGSAPSH
jgi:hypothetical protein